MKKIENLIPLENINVYFHLYKVIKGNEKKVKDSFNFYHVTEGKIRKALGGLVRVKQLTVNHSEEIMSHIHYCIAKKDDLNKIPLDITRQFLSRQGAPKDWALDVLIFSLVKDCLIYSRRPGYSAISVFLNRQEIMPPRNKEDGFSDANVSKRYKKIKEEDIKDILIYFDVIHAANQRPPGKDPLILLHLAQKYHEDGYLNTLDISICDNLKKHT